MSYYTRTFVAWEDADRAAGDLPPADILAAARAHLQAIGWPLDALDDLARGLANGGEVSPGFNQLRSTQIAEMFRAISAAIPDVTFYVRGMGEEFFDLWAVVLRDGDVQQMHGPFDE